MNKCPKCGSIMVEKPPEKIYLTYPAQYDKVLWCGCGYTENCGRVWDKTPEESLEQKWSDINNI